MPLKSSIVKGISLSLFAISEAWANKMNYKLVFDWPYCHIYQGYVHSFGDSIISSHVCSVYLPYNWPPFATLLTGVVAAPPTAGRGEELLGPVVAGSGSQQSSIKICYKISGSLRKKPWLPERVSRDNAPLETWNSCSMSVCIQLISVD